MSRQGRPIEQARDAALRLSRAPLLRAAQRAREIAARTGTALIVSEGGHVRRIEVGPLSVAAQAQQPPAANLCDDDRD